MNELSGVRFAPSPTGRLHVGNLRTAWISFKIAKRLGEPWHVRFEDIDKPRVIPGAAAQQLGELRELGLEPDEVVYQSAREGRHWELFKKGVEEGKFYPCYCSMKGIRRALEGVASAANGPDNNAVYTGHCRELSDVPTHQLPSIGWRFRSDDPSGQNDFIVARCGPSAMPGVLPKREEFVPAYHWACGIDDLDAGYSVIVRAWDLEPAVAVQREIQHWVSPRAKLPAAFHASLIVTEDEKRLEKRTQGVTLEELKIRGLGVEKLTAIFERSFAFPDAAAFRPGAVTGEKTREVKLSGLFGADWKP